jgi:hypothetical protein
MSAARHDAGVTGGRPWGMLAEYATVEAVLKAAERVRNAGFTRFDVHSPIPIHGLDEAMGNPMSRIPWAVAVGGAVGAFSGFFMQWWMNAFDYAILVSRKPLFGWPAAVPVGFELTILLGALGAIGGLFVTTGLPLLYHPLFKVERFARATTDRFFVCIEAADPLFDEQATRTLLQSTGADWVGDVED